MRGRATRRAPDAEGHRVLGVADIVRVLRLVEEDAVHLVCVRLVTARRHLDLFVEHGEHGDGAQLEQVEAQLVVDESDLVVHREGRENASYAYMLSRMEYPAMPLPFGVLRAIDRPSYNEMLFEQIETAAEQKGPGDLNGLFNSGDTWRVE